MVLAAWATCALAATPLAGCGLFDFLGTRHRDATIAWHVTGTAGGTPAFDGATVFFISRDHSVIALDGATGARRWQSPTGAVGNQGNSSCRIVGALVACGDSGIVAFDRTTGALAWQYNVPRDQPGMFPFVTSGTTIFAGSNGAGTVYAIDAVTGAQRWAAPVLRSDPAGANIPSLASDSDIVVAVFVRGTSPQSGGIIALDAATGAVRWVANFSLAAPDSASGGISVALWQSSVLASSNDGRIYMLDRATGAIQMFFPGVGQQAPITSVRGPVGPDVRQISVSGSTLFATSLSSWFIAYDLVQRSESWRVADADGSAFNALPVVDANRVFFTHFNGRVGAFSTTAPKYLWDIGGYQDAFFGTPAVGTNRLFVASLIGFWAIDD